MGKYGCGPVRVLLVPPLLERNAESVVSQLREGQQLNFTFYWIENKTENHGINNSEALLDSCRKLIRAEGIKVLYANKSVSVLAMAILCEEFPHLLGPSVTSIFLCNHKYYTSVFVDSRKTFPYLLKNITKDRFDVAYDLLRLFIRPAIIRFALGSGHTIYKYKNRDQLLQVLAQCQKNITHVVDIQRWLIKTYVDCDRYPQALEPVVLVQPFLDRCLAPQGMTWRNVSIEACVCRREIILWAIVDGVTLPYNHPNPTKYFCGCEMPTRLNIVQQQILWKAFTGDIQNLINEGFNNSFLHAEYMVFENGTVHLITMNSRLHAKCVHMYKYGLINGNNVKASFDLARGLRPRTPAPSGKYVLNYSLVIYKSVQINDVIKFAKASHNSHVHLNYSPGEEVVMGPVQDFVVLGYITVPGESFADCILEIKKIRNDILKKPQMIPFTE